MLLRPDDSRDDAELRRQYDDAVSAGIWRWCALSALAVALIVLAAVGYQL